MCIFKIPKRFIYYHIFTTLGGCCEKTKLLENRDWKKEVPTKEILCEARYSLDQCAFMHFIVYRIFKDLMVLKEVITWWYSQNNYFFYEIRVLIKSRKSCLYVIIRLLINYILRVSCVSRSDIRERVGDAKWVVCNRPDLWTVIRHPVNYWYDADTTFHSRRRKFWTYFAEFV